MEKRTKYTIPKAEWTAFENFMKALDALEKRVGNRNGMGSIGEHIATQAYNIRLNKNKRATGYDGTIGETKVEVKLHDSEKRTNIQIKRDFTFEDLIVVIGKNSKLFNKALNDDRDIKFYLYRFEKYQGGNVGPEKLKKRNPDYMVTSMGEIMEFK